MLKILAWIVLRLFELFDFVSLVAKFSFKVLKKVVAVLKWIAFFTVAILIALQLAATQPPSPYPMGNPVPRYAGKGPVDKELLPNTNWNQISPCEEYLDVEAIWSWTIDCLNKKAPDFKHNKVPNVAPGRCFVVNVTSPDVVLVDNTFNGVLIQTPFGDGAILGFYREETDTIFIIENGPDLASVLSHEMIHRSQAVTGQRVDHPPGAFGQCQPPTYSPSDKAKVIAKLMNDQRL